MKTILLLVSLIFAGMALGSCTNDEGEDLEILTPTDEEEILAGKTIKATKEN